jgi:membrane protease YdiL (CAAX protease family)
MNTYLKYKPAWLQLVVFGSLTFGMYLSLGLVAFFGIAQGLGVSVDDIQQLNLEKPGVITALKWLQAVLSLAIFLIPAIVFAYLSDRRAFAYLGHKAPQPSSFWWLGVTLMLLAYPAASWLNLVNQQIQLPAAFKTMEASMRLAEENAIKLMKGFLVMEGPADLIAMLLLIAVLPAICEEFFFRGVLQRLFIQITRRPWIGIIITAVLFSAFHGQFFGFFPRLLLGILLGAIYWYSGSIWPAVLGHFINNAVQVILVYRNKAYIDQEPVIEPVYVILSVLAIIGIIWYMQRISHTHYGELYDTDDDLILPSRRTNTDE